jgi:type II secretory pathway pseudopilin PulG
MAPKYTISKALIQTSSNGFTLIELLVGLIITFLIGGLAMDAFINASNMFKNDQRNINNDQNLSAVLEVIGNDIKQSGEQIGDANFPALEIKLNDNGTTADASDDFSTIIIRRALTSPLTLCEKIDIGADPTALTVADFDQRDYNSDSKNCEPFPVTVPATTIPLSPTPVPQTLKEASNYRCKLGDPNADYSTSTNFCATALVSNPTNVNLQKVRAAISDKSGHLRTFTYASEDLTDPNADITKRKYKINITNLTAAASDPRNNVLYDIGSPIYLIEERTYSLDSTTGKLTVSVNGSANSTLIKGIAKFRVSARIYSDPTLKVVNPTPNQLCTTTLSGTYIPPNPTPTAENPRYACKFNFNTVATDASYNWKTLAGIKVELQAKYDGTGRNSTPTDADIEKLNAVVEFFPRNVLSK